MSLSYERRWGSRRERREDGRARGAGDEARTSYYGVPPIHAPHWRWLIVSYFFLGGIAGASYVIASLARLVGGDEGRRIERAGRYVSLAALVPSPLLLILDLGRPERFLNMLRIVKLRSPMSVGTWGLTVFSAFCTLSAAIQAAEDGLLGRGRTARLLRRLPSRAVGLAGAAPAFFVSGYTGVLLAATAVPVWAKSYRLIGPLFVSSALSSAGAAITLLLARGRGNANEEAIARLERLDLIARTAELSLLAATHRRLGPVIGQALTGGRTGRVYRLGVLGTGVSVEALALLGRRSRRASVLGALLTLVGGFLIRYVWVTAGHASAADPEATFSLTRARRSAMSDEVRRRFEERYATVRQTGDTAQIPWSRERPNALLLDWLERTGEGDGKRALVVGCGLGDDAEALAAAGYRVTAIDIAPSAVDLCRERFPDSGVDYRVADLLAPPPDLENAFDLVFEAYTLQALPAELRPDAMRRLAGFPAAGGRLLVVTRAKRPGEVHTGPGPDGLTRDDLARFGAVGLTEIAFDEVPQSADRPWPQYRVVYRRD